MMMCIYPNDTQPNDVLVTQRTHGRRFSSSSTGCPSHWRNQYCTREPLMDSFDGLIRSTCVKQLKKKQAIMMLRVALRLRL
eukprot:scaffold15155_cov152-Skeletonema_dohrnii-CCMP3373.AAC.2